MRLQPELDATGSHKRRRQAADVHCSEHEADAAGTLALQAVEHREEIPIEPGILSLEDHITVVDEDHGRSVAHGRFEDVMQLRIEMRCSGDDGSVDEKKLPTQTMRERATDGGLARSWRSGEQNAALWLERQLCCKLAVLEGKNDVCLERTQHVIQALQVLELDRLNFAQIDVAHELRATQILDERLSRVSMRCRLERRPDRYAGPPKLARAHAPRKAMDLRKVH